MANKIVQLTDKDGDNIYPLTAGDLGTAKITMTSTDPGEGQPLAENNFVAVYGSMGSLLNMFYPVGSYYETSDTSFDPNVSWGGTWVEDSTGKVTVAQDTNDTDFDTIGDTGGLKQTNHVFYRPPINTARAQDAGQTFLNHIQNFVNAWLQSGGSSSLTSSQSVAAVGGEVRSDGQINTEAGFFKYTSTNLQPYITVKRWHRTA